MRTLNCPGCGKPLEIKESENSCTCSDCGCTVTISFSVTMPKEAAPKAPEEAPVSSAGFQAQSPESSAPAKKQINVFGPASLVLGVLTLVFAFLAGLKALVFGIPALIVGALGLFACVLLKNVRKWLPVAGLIASAAGIVTALILRSGFVF